MQIVWSQETERLFKNRIIVSGFSLFYSLERLYKGEQNITVLTLRLPTEKHQRLKQLAKKRGMTLNRLLDEMTTLMLAEFDLETRYQARYVRGKGKTERGLELLEKAKRD